MTVKNNELIQVDRQPRNVSGVIAEISDLFKRRAKSVFLIEAETDRVWTYAEFEALVNRRRQWLVSLGLVKSDRVVFILKNSADFAACYFACFMEGLAAVPVNPLLHSTEIEFILKNSGAKTAIFEESTRQVAEPFLNLPGFSFSVLADAQNFSSENMPVKADEAGIFLIIFTSGTTSRPKAVTHSIDTLFSNAKAFNREMGIHEEDRFLHLMAMSYMAGFLNTLLCPFAAGAGVVLCRPFDAQTILSFWKPVIRHKADTFWLSPTMAAALTRLDRDPEGPVYARQKIKAIFAGTAPLSFKIKEEFEKKYGTALYESYGLSELLLVTANHPSGDGPRGSVGRIPTEIEVKIEKEKDAAAEGEIFIKTPYRMIGYLDYKTSKPAPPEEPEWFASGDIGFADRAGYLFITGRKKELIIRGGVNISPRAIEEVLLEHPDVVQAAVVGIPHDFYGEEVAAVLRFKEGSQSDWEKSILEHCRRKLSTSSIPGKFSIIESFPVTTNGKIQKNKLVEMIQKESSGGGGI